jgi:hypothetical protein
MSALTKIQINGLLGRHLPRGWTLRLDAELSSRGRCNFGAKRITLKVPVTDRNSLFVFLHEVGHVRCHAKEPDGAPDYLIEYEAERYAIAAMRHEGVPVPRIELDKAKENVREELKGRAVPRKIWRWCNG